MTSQFLSYHFARLVHPKLQIVDLMCVYVCSWMCIFACAHSALETSGKKISASLNKDTCTCSLLHMRGRSIAFWCLRGRLECMRFTSWPTNSFCGSWREDLGGFWEQHDMFLVLPEQTTVHSVLRGCSPSELLQRCTEDKYLNCVQALQCGRPLSLQSPTSEMFATLRRWSLLLTMSMCDPAKNNQNIPQRAKTLSGPLLWA